MPRALVLGLRQVVPFIRECPMFAGAKLVVTKEVVEAQVEAQLEQLVTRVGILTLESAQQRGCPMAGISQAKMVMRGWHHSHGEAANWITDRIVKQYIMQTFVPIMAFAEGEKERDFYSRQFRLVVLGEHYIKDSRYYLMGPFAQLPQADSMGK